VDIEPLDTSDIDRWIGQPIGGEQLREPITVTDVRRWAQAMQNPNPLHFDQDFARTTSDGQVVAPQSFILACAVRHGIVPSIQGALPGSHQMNAGDEWWFSERVNVGDSITSVRQAIDYRIATTNFAGPTVFQRGDTTYLNQSGRVLARQRATAMRYLVANLRQKSTQTESAQPASWSDEQLEEIEEQQLSYARGCRTIADRSVSTVVAGESLRARPLGPHSIQSFTTEQRAYLYTVWGNLFDDGLAGTGRSFGAVDAMRTSDEKGSVDPTFADGLYHGGGRGHTTSKYAQVVGMQKPYGYGASMSAYVLDYVANWAGNRGTIVHSSLQYRAPVYVGDVTYIGASVTDVRPNEGPNHGSVVLAIKMTDQGGKVLATGSVEVRLLSGG
jgi:acyl dehydratase